LKLNLGPSASVGVMCHAERSVGYAEMQQECRDSQATGSN
jgi:hypothetical protein